MFLNSLLYILADTYPDGVPRQTHNTSEHVIRAPLFAGDKNPRQANTGKRRKFTNIFVRLGQMDMNNSRMHCNNVTIYMGKNNFWGEGGGE